MRNNYRLADILYITAYFSFLSPADLPAQPVETIDRLRNKAEMLYAKGDYTQALTAYLDGYRLARRLDPVRAANLTVDISSIYHMQGDYRRGATICQAGVALLTGAATKPDSVWFKLNSSLGEMYKKLNSQDSCYLYFSRANAILQKHPELESRIPEYVIYHYNNQGMMYVRDGGYTEGLSYLTKALFIAEKHAASKEDVAILQNNLGEIYEQLGLFGKALLLRKSAITIYPKNDFYKYQIYNGASWDALQSTAYNEGIFYATIALSLAKSIARTAPEKSNSIVGPLALNRLGYGYYLAGHYKKSDRYYIWAINRFIKQFGSKGIGTATSYLGLAHNYKIQKRIDDALFYCQKAVISSHLIFTSTNLSSNPDPEQTLSEQSLFEALVLKAILLTERFSVTKKVNDLHNSHAAYEHALAIADAMRKGYNALETKWFFATQVRPAYLGAFETAYTLYGHTRKAADKERTFRLLERLKATALSRRDP